MTEEEPVVILDLGLGNLRSISNMLNYISVKNLITRDPKNLERAKMLVLPGVGSFDYGMSALKNSGLFSALEAQVLGEEKPLLGICLGAQLLTRGSEEGSTDGIGWLDAETIAFDRSRFSKELKVPHMGWTDTEFGEDWRGEPGARFYFVHSYHMACSDPADAFCRSEYGYSFCSGIRKNNITAVQFHPEKSHRFGMDFFRTLLNLAAV